MTFKYDEEVAKIRGSIKKLGLSFLTAQDCEDLVHDVMVYRMQKKSKKQLYKHSVLDVLRKRVGRKTSRHYKDRLSISRPMSFEDYMSKNSQKQPKTEIQGIMETFCESLQGSDRAVFILYFRWGLSLIEIGELYDRSEAWASIKISKILERVRTDEETSMRDMQKVKF